MIKEREGAYQREYHKKYNRDNKESISAHKRRYYRANKERILDQQKAYREANRDHCAVVRKSYESRRYAEDINFRLLVNIRRRFKLLLTNKHGRKTMDFFDYDMDELRAHMEAQFVEDMSWDNYGEWHIDHIKPCVLFDHQDPEQVRKCWALSNLQPLWAEDNLKKGARHDELTS
jgi:hypothetical protein